MFTDYVSFAWKARICFFILLHVKNTSILKQHWIVKCVCVRVCVCACVRGWGFGGVFLKFFQDLQGLRSLEDSCHKHSHIKRLHIPNNKPSEITLCLRPAGWKTPLPLFHQHRSLYVPHFEVHVKKHFHQNSLFQSPNSWFSEGKSFPWPENCELWGRQWSCRILQGREDGEGNSWARAVAWEPVRTSCRVRTRTHEL